MNTRLLNRLLLLEQSGELSPQQRRRLAAELARLHSARHLPQELHTLARFLPPPATHPAPDAALKIAARLRPPPEKPVVSCPPAWKPLLAAAAVLALLLGIRAFHATEAPPVLAVTAIAGEEEEWTDPLDADFTELETLLLAVAADIEFQITEF